MSVDIDSLLALSQQERREIAEKLWESLSLDNALSEEDEEVIRLLEERWQNIKSGKSELYSPAALREKIRKYRN